MLEISAKKINCKNLLIIFAIFPITDVLQGPSFCQIELFQLRTQMRMIFFYVTLMLTDPM